ncbi:hypothetical protein FA13DRAFT_1732800 [Coprinellus micaceus]|uniref:Apple domain-containing protein n=1 Tax=Coprinellus micaceus TaxID=71717 RepID=A0A4Y7TB12_COPMI|nr:hypothetical protein FA13DRAFT_1732800 [Coprinellus micaceus]
MQLTTILSATLALAASTLIASPLTVRDENAEAYKAIGYDLSKQSHYGAPKHPGQHGATPGWYYGKYPKNHPNLPCLTGNICGVLTHFPNHLQCPRPPTHGSTTTTTTTTTRTTTTTSRTTTTTTATVSVTATVTVTGGVPTTPAPTSSPSPGGYTPLFSNATGATEASDYLTFGLVDSIEDCWEMCDAVVSCGFVNSAFAIS